MKRIQDQFLLIFFDIKSENWKTKKDVKTEDPKKPKPSEPKKTKKANGVPRKSSTQSRSGNEKEAPASQKREFRRSLSSDSSLSSRPSSGTRETVAERILRHHYHMCYLHRKVMLYKSPHTEISIHTHTNTQPWEGCTKKLSLLVEF